MEPKDYVQDERRDRINAEHRNRVAQLLRELRERRELRHVEREEGEQKSDGPVSDSVPIRDWLGWEQARARRLGIHYRSPSPPPNELDLVREYMDERPRSPVSNLDDDREEEMRPPRLYGHIRTKRRICRVCRRPLGGQISEVRDREHTGGTGLCPDCYLRLHHYQDDFVPVRDRMVRKAEIAKDLRSYVSRRHRNIMKSIRRRNRMERRKLRDLEPGGREMLRIAEHYRRAPYRLSSGKESKSVNVLEESVPIRDYNKKSWKRMERSRRRTPEGEESRRARERQRRRQRQKDELSRRSRSRKR